MEGQLCVGQDGGMGTHRIHAFMMITLLLRKIQMQIMGAGSAREVQQGA